MRRWSPLTVLKTWNHPEIGCSTWNHEQHLLCKRVYVSCLRQDLFTALDRNFVLLNNRMGDLEDRLEEKLENHTQTTGISWKVEEEMEVGNF